MNYLHTYESHNSVQDQFDNAVTSNDIVKATLLLTDTRVDPAMYDNEAIQFASKHGYIEIVQLLLADKRVDPTTFDNYAIRKASQNGHVEVVKLLLADSRVDPAENNNQAIGFASRRGHIKIVKLLLTDHRVNPLDVVRQHLDNELLMSIIIDEGYMTAAEIGHYKDLNQQGFI